MDVRTRANSRKARLLAVASATCLVSVMTPPQVAWAGAAIPNPPADGTAPGAELVGHVLGEQAISSESADNTRPSDVGVRHN